jgi:glucose-6-phosphate 1-dehydrogenase
MPLKPTTVVLFGATGDLSRRKLLPGLLHLFQTGLMRDVQVVGTSLDDHDRDSFIEFAHQAVQEFAGDDGDTDGWTEFSKLLHWAPGDRGPQGLRR